MSQQHVKLSNKKGDQIYHHMQTHRNIFGTTSTPLLFSHNYESLLRKESSLKKTSSTTYRLPTTTDASVLGKSQPVWIDHAVAEEKAENDRRAYQKGLEPVTFEWKNGGYEVYLTGTFDGWSKSVLMKPKYDDVSVFVATTPVDTQIDVQYKFVVDGEWRYAEDQPYMSDSDGNINNVIHVGDQSLAL